LDGDNMENSASLMDFPRKHPECNHCGELLAAVTNWEQHIHDTCPCICHTNKTTSARASQPKPRKGKNK
jgi:hypothetical protein